MNTITDFDRRAATWLADGPTELNDRVLDAALREVHLTKQRRALRVPWRFPPMPAFARSSGLAAVAVVAVIGAGALLYLNRPANPGAGSTTAPTTAPTAAPITVAPLPSGIPAWTTFTSTVYGYTLRYPSDWRVYAPASIAWEQGQDSEAPSADTFISPTQAGEEIGIWVFQVPAPAGADFTSTETVGTALVAVCESLGYASCEPAFPPSRVCVGEQCAAGYITLIGDTDSEIPHGFFRDPKTGRITVFVMGREDTYPLAAKYGGTHALLRAMMEAMDVE